MSYQYNMEGFPRSSLPRRPRQGFQLSLIIGDPFALSTISIAVIGWIIALGGSIAVDVGGKFPTLTWWGIAFEFVVILGVIHVYGAASIHSYRMALVSFLATATVYTTNSTNNFVWTGTPASGAVAAGHILLSIINILWTFYFGTTEDAPLHAWVDSFAIHGHQRQTQDFYTPGVSQGSMARQSNPFMTGTGGMNESISMNYRSAAANNNNKTETTQHPMFTTSDQLNAYESSNNINRDSLGAQTGRSDALQSTNTDALTVPTEYPYKAVALYAYTASPEDANEISFEKDEILDVADTSGKWWQARRANGQVGICPSNYVKLSDQ